MLKLLEDFQDNETNFSTNFESIQHSLKFTSSETINSLAKVEILKQNNQEAKKNLENLKKKAKQLEDLGSNVTNQMNAKGQTALQGSVKKVQSAVANLEKEMAKQEEKVSEKEPTP